MPVVVAELKLSDIQVKVFFANLVEGADAAALDQRPEAFDRVGVQGTNNMFADSMIDACVRIALLGQAFVARPLVGAEQAYLVRDGFLQECGQRAGADVFDDARHGVALALDGANNSGLASENTPAAALAGSLVLMLVVALTANEGFVNLHNAAKLFDVFNKRRSDLVAHKPSGFVGTKAHEPHDLKRAHSLFAGQHQMSYPIPVAERLVGVLKDCASNDGKTITDIGGARVAMPFEGHCPDREDLGVAAAWADHAIGPSASDQVRLAGFLIGKHGLELGGGELVDGLGLFAGHSRFPPRQELIWH